jgi:hypothetical protein
MGGKKRRNIMKYLVSVNISALEGNKIEESGGPGNLFNHLVERYRPEAFYITPTHREAIMVADFSKESQVTELMLAVSSRFNTYPTFTPVIALKDAPEVIKQAMEGAKTFPKIG